MVGEMFGQVRSRCVDSRFAAEMWRKIADAGKEFGITPYGTETMHVLRAEKGYVIVGQDTDGSVTVDDLGLSWAISKTKQDFIGKRSFTRPDTSRKDRKQLVGLLTEGHRAEADLANGDSRFSQTASVHGHLL